MARLGPIAMPQVHRFKVLTTVQLPSMVNRNPSPFPGDWVHRSLPQALERNQWHHHGVHRARIAVAKRLSEVIPLSVMGWLPQHRAVQQGSRVSAHRRSRANTEQVTSGRIRPQGGDAPGGRSTRCGNRTTTMHPDQAGSDQWSHAGVPTSGLDLRLIWMPANSQLATEPSLLDG